MLKKNDTLLLFPNQLHYGTHVSEEPVSYYWTHFYLTDPHYEIKNTSPMPEPSFPFSSISQLMHDKIVLPEKSILPASNRSASLFTQLMGTARRELYESTYKCHYALSQLLLEVCSETHSFSNLQKSDVPPRLSECIDWIQQNHHHTLSAAQLARQFSYSPAHLSVLFKKYTGYSVIEYVNRIRIASAKMLLSNPITTIEAIATQCGFGDVKYFYRVFKRYENMTPNTYRAKVLH